MGPCPLNNDEKGCRASTSRKYLGAARSRPNLDIVDLSSAEQLLLSGTRVRGAVFRNETGVRRQILADETVLCSGALATPHLLQLSGIGPEEVLHAAGIQTRLRLPGVGLDLQDHPTVELVFPRTEAPRHAVMHPHQVVLRYTSPGSTVENDMILYGLMRYDLRAFVFRPMVNLAFSRGRITLATRDPQVQPHIDLNYYARDEDLRRQREGIELCLRLTRSSAMAGLGLAASRDEVERLGSDTRALNRWIRQNACTGYHPTSTCRMGPADDPAAVVGPSGLVHGLTGLRVADASIMPTNVRANTNATVVMLAERIGAMIMEEAG